MTTVITRYFEDATKAHAARKALLREHGLAERIVRVFDEKKGMAKALAAADVVQETASAYESRMSDGGAVLLVKAGFKPLGVAQTTRDVTAAMGAVPVADVAEENKVRDETTGMLSVLDHHPKFLTRDRDPDSTTYHMANWPIPLISRRVPFSESSFPRHARMARWPFPLTIRRKPNTKSIFPRHARMAKFPIPLISKRKPYTGSVIPRHGRMAAFPIPLLSRRKPYTKSLIPRHQRMATWPFPLLINGKTGQNALIPGGPRMANFPFGLLSDRKPFNETAIPRHGRMAAFPIPLLSKRKPFTGSMIPKHGHMADAILPLVMRSGEASEGEQSYQRTFSKVFGMKTIIRR